MDQCRKNFYMLQQEIFEYLYIQIHRYTNTHIQTYTYIFLYLSSYRDKYLKNTLNLLTCIDILILGNINMI